MSSNDEEFLKTLLATFKIEGEEHITAIGAGLVELENAASRAQRQEVLETIFREAHSLKGAARAVNLGKLEGICQSLETIFAQIKAQDTPLTTGLFDRLHHMVAAATSEVNAVAAAPDQSVTPPPRTSEPGSPVVPAPDELPATAPTAEKTPASDSVRVSPVKLDNILRQAEELIASKATAAHRVSAIQEIKATVALWERDWRKAAPEMRSLQRAGERNPVGTRQMDGADKTRDRTELLTAFLDRNQRAMQSIGSQISALGAAMEQDRRTLDRRVGDLLDGVKGLSMVPFSTLLSGFPKLVRDLCRDCDKDAELSVRGGEIEGSRRILDEIKDPVMHLIRNCIDHGIESPAERARLGKPTRAKIAITVTPISANKVELVVRDDGAGIDTRKVISAAGKQGLTQQNGEAKKTDAERALSLVFVSGLSTSPMITSVSGRGLGLAIVREKVERVGGEVAVESALGAGTTFRLTLPLTLATFRGILIRAAGELFVIPTLYVQRALRVNRNTLKTVENQSVLEFNGRPVPVVWLAEVLGVAGPPPDDQRRMWPGVLLEWAGQQILFLVNEVLHDQEVLVKSLGKQLVHVNNISGAAVLETGRLAPVLNVSGLMRSAVALSPSGSRTEVVAKEKSILVVEDSITSRTLLRGILESYGYKVNTAVNGAEGFALLENEKFDLVVSDVEMPRMSGLDLTAKIRATQKFADVPVVLVTALDSRADRERGLEVGANAYIVKSSFDQSNLLEVVQRLI